jgi:hypothetical protein
VLITDANDEEEIPTEFSLSQNYPQLEQEDSAMTNRRLIPLCILLSWFLWLDNTLAQLTETKLTASDGEAWDYFGWSISLSGNLLLMGTKEDDDKGTDAGAAYVYHYDGSTWVEETKLTASDGKANELFGWSAAIAGDYAMVGTKVDTLTESGYVYFYHYDGSSWPEEAIIVANDGGRGDWFGYDISISGDRALIGSPHDDVNEPDAGSAYIFRYNGSNWVEEAKLTASDGAAYDYFGNTVFLSGDYALVGAYGVNDKGANSGAVYVFHYDGTSWVEEAKLTATDGGEGDRFGRSISLSGNFIIVGAPYHDGIVGDEGGAYVFQYDGLNWVEQTELIPSDLAGSADHFGRSVSVSGEFALVGSSRDDDLGFDAGSAYVFHYNGSKWVEHLKILPSDGAQMDHFGRLVLISSDYAVVENWLDDDKGLNSGSVYVYTGFAAPKQVVLYSPADGALASSENVVLVWQQSSPNIDRYLLEYATDSLFVNSTIDSSLTDTTAFIAQLQHNQNYWWRVRAHNSEGWGAFSEERSFLVYLEAPTVPVLFSPADGSTGVSTSPTLSWVASIAAESYGLQVSDTADFSRLVVREDSLQLTSLGIEGLSNIATYYWHVRARNANGISPWSGAWSFTTELPLPPPVCLVDPASGAIVGSDSALLAWCSGDTGVDHYWLEYAPDSLFTGSVIDSTVSDTTAVVYNLQNETTYWWRVRAHNSYGWGGFSEIRSFYVFATAVPCDSIDLFQARCISGGTIQARAVLLDNSQYAGEKVIISIDGVNYTLTIVTNGRHSWASVELVGQQRGNHLVTLASPVGCFSPDRVSCVGGLAKADDEWLWVDKLLGESVSSIEVPTTTVLLDNYPNPFNPTTTIRYGLPDRMHVQLEVFNMLGQRVAMLVDGEQEAGYHSAMFDGSGLASGVYVYRLSTSNFVQTKRLVLVR